MLRSEFAVPFGILTESFGKKQSDHLAQAYFEALQYCDVRDFEYAVTRILQDDAHFPKVPRILEFIQMQERRSKNWNDVESQFFSFECRECGDRWAAFKIHVVAGTVYTCGCGKKFYGEPMREAMVSAQVRNEYSVII